MRLAMSRKVGMIGKLIEDEGESQCKVPFGTTILIIKNRRGIPSASLFLTGLKIKSLILETYLDNFFSFPNNCVTDTLNIVQRAASAGVTSR